MVFFDFHPSEPSTTALGLHTPLELGPFVLVPLPLDEKTESYLDDREIRIASALGCNSTQPHED
jgi:hypothetical protein